jgi:hypothetical protein
LSSAADAAAERAVVMPQKRMILSVFVIVFSFGSFVPIWECLAQRVDRRTGGGPVEESRGKSTSL